MKHFAVIIRTCFEAHLCWLEKDTWMSSWSDRQTSTLTVSDPFGARTVGWDLPPNMSKMRDLIEVAYVLIHTSANTSSVERKKK